MVPDDQTQPTRIYHESFREFLSDQQRSTEFHVNGKDYHPIIAKGCLELMLKKLKHNICCISDPCLLNNEVKGLSGRPKTIGRCIMLFKSSLGSSPRANLK
ncbi:hypothetical protein BJ138DRAFT_1156116 [Hygrophoropsis aurantiaca]|uniref:Uncharacterized protein n=1 Tax=Hygrophoropsis aurantiaca TaxID=72124 RepID=A0ACB8A6H7_9AGAM|nr:hypothetical protein BJ138DRAFT_1156116 [Hygrophoropsis aurantiaca]